MPAFRLPAPAGPALFAGDYLHCVNHLARHLQANVPVRAFSRVSWGWRKAKIIFATYGTHAPEGVI
jgi:hypothetical protein